MVQTRLKHFSRVVCHGCGSPHSKAAENREVTPSKMVTNPTALIILVCLTSGVRPWMKANTDNFAKHSVIMYKIFAAK